jgi:hypothetical protein
VIFAWPGIERGERREFASFMNLLTHMSAGLTLCVSCPCHQDAQRGERILQAYARHPEELHYKQAKRRVNRGMVVKTLVGAEMHRHQLRAAEDLQQSGSSRRALIVHGEEVEFGNNLE